MMLAIPLWLKGVLVAMLMAGAYALFSHWKSGIEQAGYDRAVSEYRAKERTAIDEARSKESFWRNQSHAAIMDGIAKDADLKRLAVRNAELSGAVGRLRDGINAAARDLPRSSVEACAKSLATVSNILGSCTAEIEKLARDYGELATRADDHAVDAMTLDAAWPGK